MALDPESARSHLARRKLALRSLCIKEGTVPKKLTPGPKPGQSRPGRKTQSTSLYLRLGAFAAVLLIVAVAAFSLLKPPPSIDAAGAVPVTVDMSGYRPASLQGKVGEPVKLKLINPDSSAHSDGGGKHQFAIAELGVDTTVQPKSEQVIAFTPTQAGTYVFYCDICCGGKENPSMQGKLTVSA